MGIFERNKKPAADDSIFDLIDEDAEPAVNHDSVLDYMVQLSDEDYKKLCKVADVYRAANKKADEILGKVADGDKIEVHVKPKDTGSEFLETDNKAKGNQENVETAK